VWVVGEIPTQVGPEGPPTHLMGAVQYGLIAAPHLPPGDRDVKAGAATPLAVPQPKGRRNLPPRRPFPVNTGRAGPSQH